MKEPWLVLRITGANNGGCTTLYPYIGQAGDLPGDYYNNLRHIKVTVGDTTIYRSDGSQ